MTSNTNRTNKRGIQREQMETYSGKFIDNIYKLSMKANSSDCFLQTEEHTNTHETHNGEHGTEGPRHMMRTTARARIARLPKTSTTATTRSWHQIMTLARPTGMKATYGQGEHDEEEDEWSTRNEDADDDGDLVKQSRRQRQQGCGYQRQ